MGAQVTQEWVATYNGVGVGSNVPRKSAVDKHGNIIIAGNSESSIDYDYIVLKYNPFGNLLWAKRYNGFVNRYDYLTDMVLDDSGNIYVTGESYVESSGGDLDWVTIKYKPNGDTAWVRSFEWTGGGPDEPFSITLDNSNNVCITGFCLASFTNGRDMVTAKYNSDGELQWAKSYSSSLIHGTDWGYSVVADDSNNIYSSGYGSIMNGNEIVTIKYNTNGDQIWIRKYPTLGADYLRPILSTTDKSNNIIVNGMYYSFGDQYAFNTIKYNSSGDLLWNRIYKGDGNLNFCFALCTDSSSNVYAAGRATSTGTGNDFVTIKYNQFGDTSWIRVYDGGLEQGDEIRDIKVDNFQNVYVTGRTDSTDGTSSYLTMKYDSSGIIRWIKKYGSPSYYDASYCINVDNNNNIIVSGFSELNSINASIRTIKYSQLTNIHMYNFGIINNYELKNYPNPFNPATKISFTIKKNEFVKIVIYDIEGKKIETIIDRRYNSGNYNVIFNGNGLPTGIYFYSLFINNNIIDTKKMILIK